MTHPEFSLSDESCFVWDDISSPYPDPTTTLRCGCHGPPSTGTIGTNYLLWTGEGVE